MAGKTKHQPIGVDIGRHGIKLVQAARDGDGAWRITASALREIPRNLAEESPERTAFIVEAITAMRGQAPFVGSNCISCLPAGVFEYKNVQMPKMPPAELANALSWEAGKRLGLERSMVRQAHYDAGEVSDGEDKRREVVLMAAPNAALEEHVTLLAQAGLKPVRVDAIPTALARAVLANAPTDDEAARLVVDLGYDAAKVLILKGTRIVFFKTIDVGARTVDHGLSEACDLSMDDAAVKRAREADDPAVVEARTRAVKELAAEISLCLRYYSVTFHAERPGELILTGGWSADEPVVAQLAKALNVPVARLELTADGEGARGCAVGFGLSLGERAVPGRTGAGPSTCFLPASFVRRAARRRVYQRYAAGLAAMVLVMVGLGWQKADQLNSLRAELVTVQEQVQPLQQQSAELAKLRTEYEAIAADAKVYERLTLPVSATSIVSAVSHLTPDAIGLEDLIIKMPRLTAAHLTAAKKSAEPAALPFVSVTMTGVAPSEMVLADFVRRMTGHGLFSEVEVGYIQPTAVGLYAARQFRVTAKVRLDRTFEFESTESTQEVAHVEPQ